MVNWIRFPKRVLTSLRSMRRFSTVSGSSLIRFFFPRILDYLEATKLKAPLSRGLVGSGGESMSRAVRTSMRLIPFSRLCKFVYSAGAAARMRLAMARASSHMSAELVWVHASHNSCAAW